MVSPLDVCRWCYDTIQLRLPECHNNPDWITKVGTTFYNFVGDSGKENTGWYSNQAYQDKVYDKIKPTEDHWLSPRMVFRAAYHMNREVLTNYHLFKNIFLASRQVINVTDTENNIVKYVNEGGAVKVKELTINKYDKLTKRWYRLEGKNLLDESKNFPLLDNLWDWYTEYERTLL